jgi:UDP-glucose 4-epimerase
MTMRVLVTGAGGFVPRAIVAALVRRGASVHAIDTAIDPALKLLWDAQGGAVTWTEGPADDLPDAPFDALVHGAAVTASPEERGETPEANVRANLLPLLRALEWAGAHARRAIVVSSSGIFSGESGPLDEDARPTPSGTYAVAKAFTEAYAAMLKDTYRRDVVCIRLSSIYGPDEYPRPSRPRVSLAARYLHQAITTGRIDVIGQNDVRDWTYAPDVADVVVLLLARPVPAWRWHRRCRPRCPAHRSIFPRRTRPRRCAAG